MESELKYQTKSRVIESTLFGIGFYFSSIILLVLVSIVFFGLSFSQSFDVVNPSNLYLGFHVQMILLSSIFFEALLWYYCCSKLKKITASRMFFMCVAAVFILIIIALLLAARLILVMPHYFIFATPIGIVILIQAFRRRNRFYARQVVDI